MRDAVNQAGTAGTTAANVGAGYGAQAGTIGSQLVPFESRQLQNPSGYSQQDIGQMLTAAQAGAGGATAGLTGAASHNAATTRNPMGFSAALDSAARSRDKAAAGASEGIAANNANVKLQQQGQAASSLGGLYGMDTRAQEGAMGQVAPDVNAEANAGKSGWLQNLEGILSTIKGGR